MRRGTYTWWAHKCVQGGLWTCCQQFKPPSCEGGYQKEGFFPLITLQNRIRGQLKLRAVMYMGMGLLGPPSSEATFPPLLARTSLPQLGPSLLDSFFGNTFWSGQQVYSYPWSLLCSLQQIVPFILRTVGYYLLLVYWQPYKEFWDYEYLFFFKFDLDLHSNK